MYAVEAEEDWLIGEFKCECVRMKAAYSRGMERIQIHNERANQILAKIHEAAHEQCPKCGPDQENKAPCSCYQFYKERVDHLSHKMKLLIKLIPVLPEEELATKLLLISHLCPKCSRNYEGFVFSYNDSARLHCMLNFVPLIIKFAYTLGRIENINISVFMIAILFSFLI